MKELHMIGVLHNDPRGYERAMNALNRLKPNILALEYPGEKYEEFLVRSEVKKLREEIDRRCRVVLERNQMNPDLFDAVEEIRHTIHGGDVRAGKEYALTKSIPLFPTENAGVRIEQYWNYLKNPDGAEFDFEQYILMLKEDRQTYGPDLAMTCDEWEYEWLEKRLQSDLSTDDIRRWLRDGYQNVLTAERLQDQKHLLSVAIDEANSDQSVVVHLGGLAHSLDPQQEEPETLFECMSLNHANRVHRHSLREYE